MIQHKRLENMLMSAKVRGKHSVECNLAEANQLIGEFKAVTNERNSLKQEIDQLKSELANQKENKAETTDKTKETKTTEQSKSTDFNGVLDGGKF